MGASVSSITTKVDLSNKGIKNLELDVKQPRILPTFSSLQTLNLAKNKIETIPYFYTTELNKSPLVLESLVTVSLAKNRLKEIPDVLFLLVNLRSLDLYGNLIEVLPTRILDFYQLRHLSLSNNEIALLPWNIHKLHQLEILQVANNKIRYLPNGLGKMMMLKELILFPNPLDAQYAKYAKSDEDKLEPLLQYLGTQRAPPPYIFEATGIFEEQEERKLFRSPEANIVHNLIKYQEGMDALRAHCEKERNSENLNFYQAVKAFQHKYNSSSEIHHCPPLVRDAKIIYERFIVDQSEEQVNLPAKATEACRKVFTDSFNYPKGINQWIFKAAFSASFDLLVMDTFLRFRGTPIAKELIAQLQRLEEQRIRKVYAVLGKTPQQTPMPMMDSIGRQRSSSLGVEHLPTHLIFPASDSPPVDFNRPRFRKAPPLSDPASPLKPAEISSPHRDSKESSAKPSRGKKPPRPDDTSSEKEKKHDKEKKSDSDKEEGKRSKHKEKEKGKEIEMIVEKENEDETVNVTPLPLENVPQPTDSENKVLSNRVDGGGGVSRPKVDAMVLFGEESVSKLRKIRSLTPRSISGEIHLNSPPVRHRSMDATSLEDEDGHTKEQ